jgi:hypothetical protein
MAVQAQHQKKLLENANLNTEKYCIQKKSKFDLV